MFDGARKSTREKIVEAAIDLFAEQGYTETTMRQIADRIGIRGSSIYHHFASKSEILTTILDKHAHALQGGIPPHHPAGIDTKPLTPAELSETLFFTLANEVQDEDRKIQKIILSEMVRNPEICNYLQKEILGPSYRHVRTSLLTLSEQGSIPRLDVDRIGSILHSLSLSFILLAAMGKETMEEGNERTSMFSLMRYLLEMAFEGKV